MSALVSVSHQPTAGEKTVSAAKHSASGNPAPGGPGNARPPSAAERMRQMLLGGVAQVLIGPIIGMVGGFMLLFGGIFLAIAWSAGPQPWLDSRRYAPVTAHVDGRSRGFFAHAAVSR